MPSYNLMNLGIAEDEPAVLTLTFTHKDLSGRKSLRTITSTTVKYGELARPSHMPLGEFRGLNVRFDSGKIQASIIEAYEQDGPTGLILPSKKILIPMDDDPFVAGYNAIEL